VTVLKVEGVSAGYGKLQIIDDVSIEAEPNEITVIVGPNGSGKSTLLKTISGLTNIYAGTIFLDGKPVSGLAPHEIARIGIAYLPQTESVFTQLKVSENFKMAAYTVTKEDLDDRMEGIFDLFPQLKNYLGQKAVNLSGGERQMVAMAMALIRKPSVLMFDEPTANLAPKLATEVLHTIQTLSSNTGLTVLLVEQNARRALEIGKRAFLFVGGKVAYSGAAKDLLEHRELGRLYLGLRAAE
jgi:branched-chain amino acid transport system ATP-binding protein